MQKMVCLFIFTLGLNLGSILDVLALQHLLELGKILIL